MNGWTWRLWAQLDWRAVSDGARDSRISWTAMLLAVLVMVGIIAGLVYLIALLRRREIQPTQKPNHVSLFEMLCAAHGLNQRERALMTELASLARVKHAASLFLRPDRFRQGAEMLGERDSSVSPTAMEDLHAKLFAASDEPEPAAPHS